MTQAKLYDQIARENILKQAKPILFNTEMVRAILDGRKTETRRVVKPRNRKACGFYIVTRKTDGTVEGVYDYDENERMFDNPQPLPYNSGDILYVRETWAAWSRTEGTMPHIYYRADYDVDWNAGDDCGEMMSDFPWCVKWRPSIHMPKEAARIFLKVTDVRVERLQNITEEQAEQEGVLSTLGIAARTGFKTVWSNTIKNADRGKYGWDVNPWVWVVEFEKIDAEAESEGAV